MMPVIPFSAEDFRRRFQAALAADRGADVGDHLFNPHLADLFAGTQRRRAAVLVPVVRREPEAMILFTLRHSGLRAHSGEIAFPGGRVDPEDAGPEDTALREAGEEIGLPRGHVEVLGRAPDYLTGSGYHVAPVVGLVAPDFALRLNPGEVEDVFEAPLSFLMNPDNHRRGSRVWNGHRRHFYEMPYGERHIWGITAGMVRVLYERLYAPAPEPLEAPA